MHYRWKKIILSSLYVISSSALLLPTCYGDDLFDSDKKASPSASSRQPSKNFLDPKEQEEIIKYEEWVRTEEIDKLEEEAKTSKAAKYVLARHFIKSQEDAPYGERILKELQESGYLPSEIFDKSPKPDALSPEMRPYEAAFHALESAPMNDETEAHLLLLIQTLGQDPRVAQHYQNRVKDLLIQKRGQGSFMAPVLLLSLRVPLSLSAEEIKETLSTLMTLEQKEKGRKKENLRALLYGAYLEGIVEEGPAIQKIIQEEKETQGFTFIKLNHLCSHDLSEEEIKEKYKLANQCLDKGDKISILLQLTYLFNGSQQEDLEIQSKALEKVSSLIVTILKKDPENLSDLDQENIEVLMMQASVLKPMFEEMRGRKIETPDELLDAYVTSLIDTRAEISSKIQAV